MFCQRTEQAPQTEMEEEPIETVEVTRKDGARADVFLNYLAKTERFRWHTGRYRDPAGDECRLSAGEAKRPRAALQTWTLAHGNKFNDQSELRRKVWAHSRPKRMFRSAPSASPETKGTDNQEANRGVEDTHDKWLDDRKRDDPMGPEETIAAGDDEIRTRTT